MVDYNRVIARMKSSPAEPRTLTLPWLSNSLIHCIEVLSGTRVKFFVFWFKLGWPVSYALDLGFCICMVVVGIFCTFPCHWMFWLLLSNFVAALMLPSSLPALLHWFHVVIAFLRFGVCCVVGAGKVLVLFWFYYVFLRFVIWFFFSGHTATSIVMQSSVLSILTYPVFRILRLTHPTSVSFSALNWSAATLKFWLWTKSDKVCAWQL